MSVVILLAGIGTTIYFYLSGDTLGKEVPEFVKIGPAFISSAVTAFPLKSLMDVRARLMSYEFLQSKMSSLSEEEQKSILTQLLTEALKAPLKI